MLLLLRVQQLKYKAYNYTSRMNDRVKGCLFSWRWISPSPFIFVYSRRLSATVVPDELNFLHPKKPPKVTRTRNAIVREADHWAVCCIMQRATEGIMASDTCVDDLTLMLPSQSQGRHRPLLQSIVLSISLFIPNSEAPCGIRCSCRGAVREAYKQSFAWALRPEATN
jgi:hypothetical protein